jgi:hypothetical protein
MVSKQSHESDADTNPNERNVNIRGHIDVRGQCHECDANTVVCHRRPSYSIRPRFDKAAIAPMDVAHALVG